MVKQVERLDDGTTQSDTQIPQEPFSRDGAAAKQNMPQRQSTGTRPGRQMFWGLTGILAITVLTLLGATFSLIDPLTGVFTTNHKQGFSVGGTERTAGDLWHDSSQYRLLRPVNILVMGIDSVPGVINGSPQVFNGPSDTMLLLRLDPDDNSIRVISIPGDSQVQIPEVGLAKLSLANARGGSALAARVVSRSLYDVPIHRYVRVPMSALRDLVEQLGGVDVFVPQRMSYMDASQQTRIDLAPGWQTLNGDQAEQFARFREPAMGGNISRVQRQQLLLKALRSRLTSSAEIPHLPHLVRIIQKQVDTNLSLEEMLALVNFNLKVEPENFQMVLLPGSLSTLSQDPNSYWLDLAGQNRILSRYFGLSPADGTSDTRSPDTLKIAVQNASGQPDLSQRVVKYLQEHGFYNVYVAADWPDVQRQTQIVVQQGNMEAAADMKKALGLGSIAAESTGDLQSDLTIRVGKDWKN